MKKVRKKKRREGGYRELRKERRKVRCVKMGIEEWKT